MTAGKKVRIRAIACVVAALLAGGACGYSADRPVPSLEAEQLARAAIDLMRHGVRLLGQHDARGAAMEFEKVICLDPANTAASELLAGCATALSCPPASDGAERAPSSR